MRLKKVSTLACAMLMALNGCALMHVPEKLKNLKPPTVPAFAAPDEQEQVSTELPPEQKAKACITTAETLETQGHDREAALLYERARTTIPDAIHYSRRLAVLYDRLGNAALAEKEFQDALRTSPSDTDLLNDYGYFQMRNGDLAAAEATFRDVLSKCPAHEQASINLGMTLAKQERWQESFEVFAPAVGAAAAHSNVGVLMAKAGYYAEAERAFQQALTLNPALPQATAFLAKLQSAR